MVGHPKRQLRNYLLDTRFQLKFTSYLVLAAAAITVLLGSVLWRSSEMLMRQTAAAVDARSRAADTSRELGNVALSSMLASVTDPAFAEELKRRSADIDRKHEAERQAIEAQRAELVSRMQRTWTVLIAALAAFIVFIALSGIYATHRIAGPIFRLKRLANEVAEGRLRPMDGALRPSDELRDLYAAFSAMVEKLRANQETDLTAVERALQEAERAGQAELASGLRALAATLRGRITP